MYSYEYNKTVVLKHSKIIMETEKIQLTKEQITRQLRAIGFNTITRWARYNRKGEQREKPFAPDTVRKAMQRGLVPGAILNGYTTTRILLELEKDTGFRFPATLQRD